MIQKRRVVGGKHFSHYIVVKYKHTFKKTERAFLLYFHLSTSSKILLDKFLINLWYNVYRLNYKMETKE